MKPDGVNGNTPAESPRVKRQQEIFEKTDDKNKLAKALAGLENEVAQAIKSAVADKKISAKEYKELSGLQLIATKYLEKAAQMLPDLVESFVGLYNKVAEVFQNEKYTVVNDSQKNYEPQETDAQTELPKPSESLAEELRIPERKFQYISDNKNMCERIKKEYYSCLDNAEYSNQMKSSKLKCFQAKYGDELKKVSSSVKDDGKFVIENLYEQIESQIRYYSELAKKDTEQIKKDKVDALTQLPKKSKKENVAYTGGHRYDNDAMLDVLGYTKEEKENFGK